MATHPDPFLTAETDLHNLLTNTRQLLTSYTRIRSTASASTSTSTSTKGPSGTSHAHTNPELLSARSDLLTSLEDLTADLQDLVDAVRAVEGDPYRYGLDVAEVERRRRLVRDVGGEVERMRGQVYSGVGNANAGGGGGGKGRAGGGGLPSPELFDSDGEGDGDGYAAFEEQRQAELLEEQDEQLEGVFRTVGNLRMQADEMGRELEEQGELLESVDGVADRVGGKLREGTKKIQWVIRKNEDTASSCCIAVLIFVLIVLLILVIVL